MSVWNSPDRLNPSETVQKRLELTVTMDTIKGQIRPVPTMDRLGAIRRFLLTLCGVVVLAVLSGVVGYFFPMWQNEYVAGALGLLVLFGFWMTFTLIKSGVSELVSGMIKPYAGQVLPFEVNPTTLMLDGQVVPWHDVTVCESTEKWVLELMLSGRPVSIPFGGSQRASFTWLRAVLVDRMGGDSVRQAPDALERLRSGPKDSSDVSS